LGGVGDAGRRELFLESRADAFDGVNRVAHGCSFRRMDECSRPVQHAVN
jgi:hypothetical protein